MYVLGIYNAHNATTALLKDGKVIACASEERFSRVKNQYGFPKHAIDYCLSEAGINSNDLDLVVIPFKYGAPQHSLRGQNRDASLDFALAIYKSVSVVRKVWGELAYRYPSLLPISKFSFRAASIIFEKFHMAKEKKFVADYLKISEDKVITVDHHETHAASVYFGSPYNTEKALVMTLDGEGDFKCATISVFENGKQKLLASSDREHSLGYIYQRLTETLGMKANEHEYKVMGLAPYAKGDEINKVYQKIKDLVYLDPKNKLVFKSKFSMIDADKYIERELYRTRFDVLAAAFQKMTEDKIVEWVSYAIKKTNIHTVLLSGGVFMNIKVNQKVSELSEVHKMFIMPSCGDESTPIGASYLGFIRLGASEVLKDATITNIYWGPSFSDLEIEKAIKNIKAFKKYKISKHKDIEKKIARLLFEKKIVSRLAGRMEWGARALGNRTIMANPSVPDVVREINDLIKGRDFWMPFAPTIMWERMDEYIKNPKKLQSPYMMLGFETTPKAQREIRSALHAYDFTARPQLVTKEANPKYHKIIEEFEKLTGIGAILNTSFNLHGYPIVCTPIDAIDCFENSGLKYLAIENYLLEKR